MIKSQDLKKYHLPDAPGVYFFKVGNQILYIGKATSLKDRVKSYFSADLISTRGPLLVDLIFRATKIDFIKTDSVLEAVILEANLIKKHQPKYNTKEKDNKSFNYVVITKEDFPRVLIVRGRNLLRQGQKKAQVQVLGSPRADTRPDHSPDQFSGPLIATFGPYTSGESLRSVMKIIRKIFPFRDRCSPLIGHPCFNRQLGLCPGVCDGTISKSDYLKIIKKIKLIFSGKIRSLKSQLKKEMIILSHKQEFEKAQIVKGQIFSLNHIQDVALIKTDHPTTSASEGHSSLIKEEMPPSDSELSAYFRRSTESARGGGMNFRIEAYDAAHLSGTDNVGVMVVMEDGEFKKSDYRKFKIQDSKGSDTGALVEMLNRRLKHTEWPYPNLVVVDGGLAQLNIAKKVFQGLPLVKIAAVTKDDHHKAKAIIGDEVIISKYKSQILQINAEAHRFAVKYHRSKRQLKLVD
jgi:excinuclease ABC subunit C